MDRIVRAFPLLPGKEARLREFVAALRSEKLEAARQFYKRFGVLHESWHLQHTPHGSEVIVITVIDDAVSRAHAYADSHDEFSLWFKAQVYELCGVDPNQNPKGPPSEEIFCYGIQEKC